MRLPAGGWEYLLAATGPVAILLLLAAANIWHARERETTLKHRPDVVRTPKVLACIALALALGGAEFRWRAVHNGGDSELTLASLLNGASLLAVVGYAFVIGNLIYLRHGGVLRVLRGVFRRQRVNIAIVGALTFALMFLGDTSGQSVDSIRSWSPLVFGTEESPFSDAGAARLALGLAAALMFALALYESGTLLVRTMWANDDPSRSHLLWFAIAILLLGVVALFLPAFGPGIVIAGAILFVLYLLDWPKVEQKLGSLRLSRRSGSSGPVVGALRRLEPRRLCSTSGEPPSMSRHARRRTRRSGSRSLRCSRSRQRLSQRRSKRRCRPAGAT